MKLKKILSLLVCSSLTVILIGGFITIPSTITNNQFNLEVNEVEFDLSNYDPSYDPKADFTVEILEALNNADPRASVEKNMETGEVAVNEYIESIITQYNANGVHGTNSYFPGELEEPEYIDSRAIIGTDNRRQLTNVNDFPYSAIAFLEVTYASGATAIGTGAFVGDKTILTSGHVLYDHTHGWARSVKVTPGGSISNFSTYTTTDVHSTTGWVSNENGDYDYGVVKISSSPGVGYYGTQHHASSSNLSSKSIYSYGFPTDKTKGTMWYDDSGSIGTVFTRSFLHSADTVGGNSGGPIVLASNYQYIVGIHRGNYDSSHNIAVRVTKDVIDYVILHT